MRRHKWPKSGTFFIPARDSRHRVACFALYRALLRLAPQVALPDELATGWGPGKNPIAIHIQRAFRRNKADVSPRIVYPALGAGYHMLSVLQAAATSPSSEHHASILAFLGSRLAERQRSLANRPPPPVGPKPGAPRPDGTPLLVNVTPPASEGNQNPKPVYAIPDRPRPRAALGGTGRRKIPHLDVATDFPFLRLTKPQPPVLSRVLRQKQDVRVARMHRVGEIWEDELPLARLEDAWETEVARLQTAAAAANGPRERQQECPERDDGESSHARTLLRYGLDEVTASLTRERVDQVARADAMRQLIIKEKALAAEEKVLRAKEKHTRWEAKMLALHGEGWRELFPNLKESEGTGKAKKD